jgi:hypothetical protein
MSAGKAAGVAGCGPDHDAGGGLETHDAASAPAHDKRAAAIIA